MKKIKVFLILPAIVLFASCSKDGDNNPNNPGDTTTTVINLSAMADFYAGATVRYFRVDSTQVSAPSTGTNQFWDFSSLTISGYDSNVYKTPVVHDSFPSANMMLERVDTFSAGSVKDTSNSRYYSQLDASGWASLGQTMGTVDLVLTGIGSINYPAQANKVSSKIYSVFFPMRYSDSVGQSGITQYFHFTVTAPAYGLNNTPGYAKYTVSYYNKVMGEGKVKLMGRSDTLKVLVLKQSTSTTINYFLNGAPAPAPLLTLAGVTDGATSTYVNYVFYSPTTGYVGTIFMNKANTAASGGSFRKYF